MKRFGSLVFFILNCLTIHAQSESSLAYILLEDVKCNLQQANSIKYDFDLHLKGPLSEDTSLVSGTCVIWKPSIKDSFQYIIETDSKTLMIKPSSALLLDHEKKKYFNLNPNELDSYIESKALIDPFLNKASSDNSKDLIYYFSDFDSLLTNIAIGIEIENTQKINDATFEIAINYKTDLPNYIYRKVELVSIGIHYEYLQLTNVTLNSARPYDFNFKEEYSEGYWLDLENSFESKDHSTIYQTIIEEKFLLGSGLEVSLNHFDHPYVLLDFWYSSCYPCLKSVPMLNELSSNYGEKKLKILAINPFDSYDKAKRMKQKKKMIYDIGFCNKSLTKKLGIIAFPTMILFGKGKVVKIFEGYDPLSFEEIEELIK